MKHQITTLLLLFVGLISAHSAEITAITDDPGPTPGDLFQGALIDAGPSTPAHPSGYDLRDAFGGEFSTIEPGRAVLADGLGSPVQKIYFHTAAPVTLSGFKLYLGDDGVIRGASHVEVAVTDATFNSSTLLSTMDLPSPYPSAVGANNIRHIIVSDTFTPVTGQYFVLRLTPADPNVGVRVIEFDGIAPQVPPAASIVAWWPGEDAVGDIIGNAHVGVASGTQAYVAGKVGRAFSFNGIDQSVNTTALTDVLNQVPLTIEGWVKPEAHATGSIADPLPTNVISNDRVNFGGHGFGVHIYPDGSKLNIGVQSVEADFRTIPDVTFAPAEWAHIAVVYSPGQAKTYVNGQLRDTFNYTQAAMEGNQVVRIGRHNDDTGFGTRRFFKGAIDELSLYNMAFTDAAINAIYSAGSNGKTRSDAGRQFSLTFPQQDTDLWKYGQINSGVIDTATFTPHAVRTRFTVAPPCSTRQRTISKCPRSDAMVKAVPPVSVLAAFTAAPPRSTR